MGFYAPLSRSELGTSSFVDRSFAHPARCGFDSDRESEKFGYGSWFNLLRFNRRPRSALLPGWPMLSPHLPPANAPPFLQPPLRPCVGLASSSLTNGLSRN